MTAVWKIVKGLLLGLVALILIAVVAAVIATDTDWFRDLARDKANAVLASTFKGQLAIGSIRGSIWRDLTIARTYRAPFILEAIEALFGAAMFYYMSRFVDSPQLRNSLPQGTTYFAFALVGLLRAFTPSNDTILISGPTRLEPPAAVATRMAARLNPEPQR